MAALPNSLKCQLNKLEHSTDHFFLILDINVINTLSSKELTIELETSEILDPPQRKLVKYEPLAPSHLKIVWRVKRGAKRPIFKLKISYDKIYTLKS
ncbi:MAG: hypothetical protein ACFFC7_14155 [Candidatus Hermodarchaeota archaeon]